MALHHVRRGSGEPLLLIQGMSGHHGHWGEPFLAALEADFELIAIDHRGTGLSPRVDGPFTLADLAADAAATLGELEVGSAHVLGVSMGGMVAQELALARPELVRSLVLGCTYAGGAEGRLTDPEVWRLLSEAMQSGDRERALRAAWSVNVSGAVAGDERRYAAFREMSLTRPVAVAVILRQMQAIGAHDTSARLGAITAPTLVVHGSEDRMLDVSNGRAIAAAIPGARLAELDGVGHMFWLEQPERSAALVAEHCLAAAASVSDDRQGTGSSQRRA